MPSNEFLRGLMPIDETGARIISDYARSRIPAGLYFTSSKYETISTPSVMTVLITAPADGQYNFMAEVWADKSSIITFSKNPNATATGSTAIIAYNHDENSTNTNTLTLVANGTTTSVGTILETHLVTAGTQPARIGFDSGERSEWRIAPSSVHLIQVTPDSTTTRTIIRTHFYRDE